MHLDATPHASPINPTYSSDSMFSQNTLSCFLISDFCSWCPGPPFMTQVKCDHLVTLASSGLHRRMQVTWDTTESLLKARDPAMFIFCQALVSQYTKYIVYCINNTYVFV